MKLYIFPTLALAVVATAGISAAADPFAGTWKLNQAKSKFTGEQMKIEDLGQNRYRFSGGVDSDTIKADGTDQPIRYGRTQSITSQGPKVWKIVTKKDGKPLSTSTWTISGDGKMLAVQGSSFKPDGGKSDYTLSAKRVGSGSGWAGTWESTEVKISSADEYVIAAYQGDGLSFSSPAYKEVLNMKFDGKDYPVTGPNVTPGTTSSGRRVNSTTLELTDKIKEKVMGKATYQVAADGKTMTVTMRSTGQPNPQIVVYDRK